MPKKKKQEEEDFMETLTLVDVNDRNENIKNK